MKRGSALRLFVSIVLLFVRTFCVNLTIFNSILSTSWEERIKGDLYNECKLFNEHKINQKINLKRSG